MCGCDGYGGLCVGVVVMVMYVGVAGMVRYEVAVGVVIHNLNSHY